MRASRSVSISLIISFIAVLMSGDLFTSEAVADCDDLTSVDQIIFGYLAGCAACGAAFIVACAVTTEWETGWEGESRQDDSGVEIAAMSTAMSTAYVLASAGTVYSIGQKAGCHGSFMGTLGGAVAAPMVGGIIGGILGGIKERNKDGILMGSLGGSVCGFLLTPISATIAYHLTKEKNNPDKKEIIVPLMRMRF